MKGTSNSLRLNLIFMKRLCCLVVMWVSSGHQGIVSVTMGVIKDNSGHQGAAVVIMEVTRDSSGLLETTGVCSMVAIRVNLGHRETMQVAVNETLRLENTTTTRCSTLARSM